MYIEIREPGSGKLLCRYDPQRRLLEHRRRGVTTVTDLAAMSDPADPHPERPERLALTAPSDYHEARQ